MDPEIAEILIDLPKGERKPLSPLGFSQSIHLQMSILEAVRVLDNTLRRVHGNKASPPRPLERPVTALQLLERERDREFVDAHLRRLGVKGI
ncbi:Uncharacterised protein [Mycobacteroides abscessus subsp. abscessus]|nr:Uncharacterised protein [Mycobacteroides abscessus subsp. abscessus]